MNDKDIEARLRTMNERLMTEPFTQALFNDALNLLGKPLTSGIRRKVVCRRVKRGIGSY
jgi:hypothetical protein